MTEIQSITERQTQQKQSIIDLLRKTPIIQIAAERAGISRATYYRWRKDDEEFTAAVDEALAAGKGLVSDMAESQLIGAIKDGNLTAVMFWLKSHDKQYGNKVEITGKLKAENALTPEQEELINKAIRLSSLVEDGELNNKE